MDRNFCIDKLYEAYSEEFIKSENYKNISKKLSSKYDEIAKKISKEELKDVDEFEQYLTSLLEIEVKNAFTEGFNVATNLILEQNKNQNIEN